MKIIKYFALKVLKPTDSKGFVPWADICVEGFPRSGNTYAVSLLSIFSDKMIVNHHTHSLSSIRWSVFFKIPTYIIIRNPLDSVLSYHVYSDRDFNEVLSEWREFHYRISKMNKIKLYDFDKLTSDPVKWLELVSNSTCAISNNDVKVAGFDFIQNLNNERNIGSTKSGMPNKNRQKSYNNLIKKYSCKIKDSDILLYKELTRRCV
jgi:hypothetical protein